MVEPPGVVDLVRIHRDKHNWFCDNNVFGRMPRKEVYCETCGSDQPMIEHEPQQDELNPYPWYDMTCGTCYSIIATVRIVPDDKPLEQSNVVEGRPYLVKK